MPYFLLSQNDDGEVTFKQVDPTQLARDITEGNFPPDARFLDKLPDEMSYVTDWPGEYVVLVKGELVIPRVMEVVTRVTIP